jgi:hypothetical protein
MHFIVDDIAAEVERDRPQLSGLAGLRVVAVMGRDV